MTKRKLRRSRRRRTGTPQAPQSPTTPPATDSSQEPADVKAVAKNLDSLPSEQRREKFQELLTLSHRREFSGPMPAPEDLKRYQEILPSSPERILGLAEKSLALTEKSLQIEEHRSAGILSNERRKIYGSILVSLGLLVLAGIAVWQNNPSLALPLGLAGPLFALLRYLMRRR